MFRRIFYFLLFLLPLCVPELIVGGFDLLHFSRGDEDRPLADIGNTICHTLEVMRHPQEPVGALDGLGVLNDEGHQFTIHLVVERIYLLTRWRA